MPLAWIVFLLSLAILVLNLLTRSGMSIGGM
jgi:hypothetical protein